MANIFSRYSVYPGIENVISVEPSKSRCHPEIGVTMTIPPLIRPAQVFSDLLARCTRRGAVRTQLVDFKRGTETAPSPQPGAPSLLPR